ncbi:MAG: FtsW/RodA/SpoVE family cell cycle protein [Chthonomonadales bacterium]|nr:FtsW/RodA/SpoVE family cell cycle protein [Chthonomonadales bacterium]
MKTDQILARSSRYAFFAAALLTGAGLVATMAADRPGQLAAGTWYDLAVTKQALAVCVGLACMVALSRTTFDRLFSLALPFMALILIALILVWVPGVKAPIEGFHRRIGIGPVTIQPGEFAKLALILMLAVLCTKGAKGREITTHTVGWCLGMITLLAVLIEREPDLGTALVILAIGLSMLYTAGAPIRTMAIYSISVTFAVLLITGFGALFGHSYRIHRITAFLNPEADIDGTGFQIVQGLISVSIGGLFGRGYGNGDGRDYLPAPNTDYVLANMIEQGGLLTLLVVAALIGLIVRHAYLVVQHSTDRFARLVAAGVGAMLLWQSLINLGVITSSIPCTGVPMPFISFGTSSLVVTLIAVGIILRPATPSPRRNALPRPSEAIG